MFKIFFIGLGLMLEARAQSIQQLLGIGQKPQVISVRWNCPQHTYPQVKQLRKEANVKIEYVEKNGELKVVLKPDVFKVNPLNLNNALGLLKKNQVALDYSECIENFKKSANLAIEMKKESFCQSGNSEPICKEGIASLNEILQAKIVNSPYLKNKENQIILQRTIPGTASGAFDENIQEALENFKNNNSYEKRHLFSAEALRSIELNSAGLNLNQLNRYKLALQEYNNESREEICSTASNLCSHISQKIQETEVRANRILDQRITRLQSTDNTFLNTLNIPKNESQASQEMRALLDTRPFECNLMNQTYDSEGRKYVATLFPKALAENIDRLAEVADKECIEGIIQNYVVAMNYRPENNTVFKEYCQNNQTDACGLARERIALMNDNFRRLFQINFGERGERYLNEIGGVACFMKQEAASNNIYQFLTEHRAALSCVDLKPGEVKNISHKDGTPSGLSGSYVLKKKENGNHEVKVNIQVESDGFGVTKDEMHERIRTCMTDASPFMKGPDGKALEFNIINPEEAKQLPVSEQPVLNKVRIQAPGTRSNSMSYKADIDCPTIAHEVLHLLGLCDEYNGVGDGYTCRTVAKVASIMSNQNEAYRLGIDKTHTCECRPGSICERIKNSNDEALKSFYLQPSIYSITSPEVRNKYCNYSEAPRINISNINQKSTIELTEVTETKVSFFTQDISDYPWPQVGRARFNCNCPSTEDEECKNELAQMAEILKNIDQASRQSCPSGSFTKATENGIKIDRPSLWNNDTIQFIQKSQLPSLLHPSHYERIVGGACASKAKKYNDCAIWAYRNKESTNNCEGKPEYCNDGKEFLGIQQ